MKKSPSSLRKARTRTLIQLGGLVEKSGILPYLDINMGDDLQLQEDLKENIDILLGSLVDIKQSLEHDPAYKKLALKKGLVAWSKKVRYNY